MTPDELAKLPPSRVQMMRKTVSASRQRDLLEHALKNLLDAIDNDYVGPDIQDAAAAAVQARIKSAELGVIFANSRPIIVPQW